MSSYIEVDKSQWGVHITHCCALHGCKYGDEDCPVATGKVGQEYSCEDCEGEVLTPKCDVTPITFEVSLQDGFNITMGLKKFIVISKVEKEKVGNLEIGFPMKIYAKYESIEEFNHEIKFVEQSLNSRGSKGKLKNIANYFLKNSNEKVIRFKTVLVSSIERHGDLTIVSLYSGLYS